MTEIVETAKPDQELVLLLQKNNVSEEMAVQISPAFTELFQMATEWNKKATDFLSDPNLPAEEKAKEARKARLALVKVRTGIEKKRKDLNEEDQKKIADRNSIGKILTGLVTPTEAILQAEEDRAENEQKAVRDALKLDRIAKLEPLGVDCTFFDLANMPEEAFSQLLENSTLACESKKAKEELENRTANRKNQLVLLGFKPHESGAYINELCDIHEEIESYDTTTWNNFMGKISEEMSKIVEEKRKLKEAEDNRLKAEKDAAERKAALLEQEEKERKVKHDTTVSRIAMLSAKNVSMDYQTLFDMTEEAFTALFIEKSHEYQAEQNRIFIEQKKKEREEALKKKQDEEAAEAKRQAEIAPEKQKIQTWINSTLMPAIDTEGFSEEGEKICDEIFDKFKGFNKWANEQVNRLK
jgi:hypothetical protein